MILCSPHKHHAAQIVAAAKAGKHVFCEKPLCTSAREMEAVAQAVTAAGVQLGIGHERRFEPGIIDLRQRLAAGELGTALLMEGNFSQDKFFALAPDNWRLSAEDAPVGPLSATGVHLMDLSIALLGRPVEVWARLATRGSAFANGDTLAVMLAFESGATAQLTAILATPFVGRVAVFGSQGWIEIRDRTHPEHPTGWDVTVVHRGETSGDALPPAPPFRARQPRGLRAGRRRRGPLSREPRRDRLQRAHLRGHHALRAERPHRERVSRASRTRRPYQEFIQRSARALLGSS